MKNLRSVVAALSALVLFLSPLAAVATEVLDGNTPVNGKPSSGDLQAGWDGTSHRVQRGDSNGNLYVYDRSTDDLRLELNLRSNNGLATKFVSSVIDLRRFGNAKGILVRCSGNATLAVGFTASYSSVMDSTSTFRVRIGNTLNPQGGDTQGGFRGIAATTASGSTDSTFTARTAWYIPLCDSATGAPISTPYGKIDVWVASGSVNNLYVHIVGGLR